LTRREPSQQNGRREPALRHWLKAMHLRHTINKKSLHFYRNTIIEKIGVADAFDKAIEESRDKVEKSWWFGQYWSLVAAILVSGGLAFMNVWLLHTLKSENPATAVPITVEPIEVEIRVKPIRVKPIEVKSKTNPK